MLSLRCVAQELWMKQNCTWINTNITEAEQQMENGKIEHSLFKRCECFVCCFGGARWIKGQNSCRLNLRACRINLRGLEWMTCHMSVWCWFIDFCLRRRIRVARMRRWNSEDFSFSLNWMAEQTQYVYSILCGVFGKRLVPSKWLPNIIHLC